MAFLVTCWATGKAPGQLAEGRIPLRGRLHCFVPILIKKMMLLCMSAEFITAAPKDFLFSMVL